MRVFKNLFGDGSKIKGTEIAVTPTKTVSDILSSRKEFLPAAAGQPFKPYPTNEAYIELVNGIVYIRGAFANTRLIPVSEHDQVLKIADIPAWANPSSNPSGGSSAIRRINQGTATAISLITVEVRSGKWGLYITRYRNGNSLTFDNISDNSFLVVDIDYPAN